MSHLRRVAPSEVGLAEKTFFQWSPRARAMSLGFVSILPSWAWTTSLTSLLKGRDNCILLRIVSFLLRFSSSVRLSLTALSSSILSWVSFWKSSQASFRRASSNGFSVFPAARAASSALEERILLQVTLSFPFKALMSFIQAFNLSSCRVGCMLSLLSANS